MVNTGLNLLLNLPILYWLAVLWKGVWKECARPADYAKYAVCIFGFVLVVPLAVCHTDTGRWQHDVLFYEMLLVAFLLLFVKDAPFQKAFAAFAERVRLGSALRIAVPYTLIYLLMDKEWMNKLTDMLTLTIAGKLVDFAVKALHVFL